MSLDVTVIVPTIESRKEWFKGYGLPSIDANDPKHIYTIIGDCMPAQKRNEGAEKSTTEYIFFCDDDIILHQDCLNKMAKAIVSHNADFVYCNYIGIPTVKGAHPVYTKPWTQKGKKWDLDRLKEGNFISPMTLFRRESFLGFDESLETLEDWDLFLRMGKAGKVGYWIDEVLFYAFYNDIGLSARTTPEHAKIVRAK